MIFPHIESELIVQVNDKTRISAIKSFTSKDESEITLVEIRPDGAESFIDVTGDKQSDWYLDWEYATDGDKTITVRITTDGSPVTETKTLTVISAADDKLFSRDSELTQHESNILKYVRPGRNTFLDFHRRAQTEILEWLDLKGYHDDDGNKLTKDSIVDVSEVRYWATFATLRLIFNDLWNSQGDSFKAKAEMYTSKEDAARAKIKFRVDLDGNNEIGDGEFLRTNSPWLVRS